MPTQMAHMPFAEHDNMGQETPAPIALSPSKMFANTSRRLAANLSRFSIGFGRGEPVARDIDATGHEHIIAVLVECP